MTSDLFGAIGPHVTQPSRQVNPNLKFKFILIYSIIDLNDRSRPEASHVHSYGPKGAQLRMAGL
jgi:hypothetical protein